MQGRPQSVPPVAPDVVFQFLARLWSMARVVAAAGVMMAAAQRPAARGGRLVGALVAAAYRQLEQLVLPTKVAVVAAVDLMGPLAPAVALVAPAS